ncbi:hypothetical protein EB796_023517 [Bugula neritina]|uniref:Uncharacterized protein n=1 Tax=Bugula neritina TaxID=10212 RepID=A0A7J7IYA0_BUGNE|nr:hypothetical protein EB796_023517 [Bugula neritina]
MIALVLTPAFKGTLADLLGWQYRIVITPTVIIVAVFHGTILGTQRIEFRPFTIAESALCSGGENRRNKAQGEDNSPEETIFTSAQLINSSCDP